MKIAVLAGGLSPEREVSLTSGSLIANALCRKGHTVALVDVYLGTEVPNGDPDALFVNKTDRFYRVSETGPDLKKLKETSGNGEALIGKNVVEICKKADVVFLALHGAMGENGQLQALLDCYGIRYTGSGYIGSLLSMDKDITKKILVGGGVLMPEGVTVTRDGYSKAAVLAELGLPCVVKPCSCGSSVGVSIVETEDALDAAMNAAFAFEDRVLIEKKIVGREMTVGILRGKALPPVEIIPKTGFYDYKNKYQAGMTDEICPPDITEEENRLLAETALRAVSLLRMGSYCRADMILSGGSAYCLEVNALPGMTPLSLLPREAAAVGISYDDLCDIIAGEALKDR